MPVVETIMKIRPNHMKVLQISYQATRSRFIYYYIMDDTSKIPLKIIGAKYF